MTISGYCRVCGVAYSREHSQYNQLDRPELGEAPYHYQYCWTHLLEQYPNAESVRNPSAPMVNQFPPQTEAESERSQKAVAKVRQAFMSPFRLSRKSIIAIGVSVVLVALTIGGAVSTANASEATVVKVIDGDTIDVKLDGKVQRVRLLNVDTPETKDPNETVQCLGPEASQYLSEALPVGSKVRLEFDTERTDKYGRLLAGVFKNNTLINGEIAALGLGLPVTIGANTKFAGKVEARSEEARTTNKGLFDPEISCTIPGIVATAQETLVAATGATSANGNPEVAVASTAAAAMTTVGAIDKAQGTIDSLAGKLKSALATSSALAVKALLPSQITRLEKSMASVMANHATALQIAKSQHERLFAKEENARVEKERAEQAAAEVKREAELAAEQERIRVEAEAQAERLRNLAPPAPNTYVPPSDPEPPAPAPAPAPDPGDAGGPPGYTGPRCYAPGGKTWKPC